MGFVLNLVGDRYEEAMDAFYPIVDAKRPWGYLWAVTLPCVNCGRRFPLVGNLQLRRPDAKRRDLGQSYRIVADHEADTFEAIAHEGRPDRPPTLVKTRGAGLGKAAVCVFCAHVHPFDVRTRLMGDGHAEDALLLVADHDDAVRRTYRQPVEAEHAAVSAAAAALADEPDFGPALPAVPDERAAGITGGSSYARYGYSTFGDFCNARQTLGFVRLARIINQIAAETSGEASPDYVAALCSYAGANLVRRMMRSTRGVALDGSYQKVSNIFTNGPAVPFGFDSLERVAVVDPAHGAL